MKTKDKFFTKLLDNNNPSVPPEDKHKIKELLKMCRLSDKVAIVTALLQGLVYVLPNFLSKKLGDQRAKRCGRC